MINFYSFNDMNAVVSRNFKQLPKDIDIVVGIPRSGMYPASMISLFLQKPLSTPNNLINNIDLGSGFRMSELNINKNSKILLVDDAINSGKQLRHTIKQLNDSGYSNIVSCCIFGTSNHENNKLCDYIFSSVPSNRVYEWNILHSWAYRHSCVDLDGVLCEDVPENENDDGEKYYEYISNASVKIHTTQTIPMIVTCRLEKYRDVTEKWLDNNNFKYDQLIMLEGYTAQSRKEKRPHARYKAQHYKFSDAKLFIESSDWQARDIHKFTNRPVYCVDSMKMYHGKWQGYSSYFLSKIGKKLGF